MGHKDIKKTVITGTGFLLMYAGFTLLLLPMIMSALPLSVTLSNTPQTFGFEDDLNSVSTVWGTPMPVIYPAASETKAIECQNGDYIHWNLIPPSKTIDLTFETYWTKFPTTANESLSTGEIWRTIEGKWHGLFSATFYCDANGDRGWYLWTGINYGSSSSVPDEVVYALETNRWYTIRMTADLNTGTFRLYIDRTLIASIMDIEVATDIYIDFFVLGASAIGDSDFTTYYDDVTVSLLSRPPPPQQWSVRITSSPGGSTDIYDTVNVNEGESLTVNAVHATGYVFSKWTLDGVDYSKSSTITVPAQLTGLPHTLHATFAAVSPEPNPEYAWLPLQVMGSGMIGCSGYVLWSQKKREMNRLR